MKKIISIIFLFPLCCVGQNNLQQNIGDCDVYINYDDFYECIYNDKSTEMLRSSNQESKDFFTKTVLNFYTKADLICTKVHIDLDSFTENKEFDNKQEDEIPFNEIKNVPRFLQCYLVDSDKARSCFQEQINTHIRRNFKYPIAAQAQGIQGRVYINFTINKCGFIENIRTRSPDKNLENEAVRIINLLPRMYPGTLDDGTPVDILFSIPITFRLE
tara:strand:- start:167 stop:814 length:648 start_codon:yes stop_codon:yes gene_type:complete